MAGGMNLPGKRPGKLFYIKEAEWTYWNLLYMKEAEGHGHFTGHPNGQ